MSGSIIYKLSALLAFICFLAFKFYILRFIYLNAFVFFYYIQQHTPDERK